MSFFKPQPQPQPLLRQSARSSASWPRSWAQALVPGLALALGLTACPDPTQTSAGPGASAGGPGAEGAGAGGPPPAGGPGAGGPGADGPGGGGNNPGARPSDTSFQVTAGEGVLLSGTYAYAGDQTGSYRIDFLQLADGSPPTLLHALTLDAPGAWSVEAPKDFGEVYVVAFLDVDEDGPSPQDPAARISDPVTIADAPIADLNLVLTADADLGDLAPAGGAPPPDGSGPPPAQDKGPQGAGGAGGPPAGAMGAGGPPEGQDKAALTGGAEQAAAVPAAVPAAE